MSPLRLGYEFKNQDLLQQALTPRSAGHHNNERLEFLGDGILNFVVASALFSRFTQCDEGDLSRLRARLVRKETLAEIGKELGLGEHMILGSGEMKSGGHRRDSILGDAVEAILGAVYLDGGFDACRDLILDWFDQRVMALPPAEELKDPKTRLQEFLQSRGQALPEYELMSTRGADHARIFEIACRLEPLGIETRGEGSSRRKAEKAAATAALQQIKARAS